MGEVQRPRMPDPASDDGNPALAPILSDLAARLRVACAHLDAGEFDRLVLQIARTRLRWDERDRRPPERS